MKHSGFLSDSVPTMIGNWELDDPCKYVNSSCRGKVFGALKDCRDRRDKSQSLCEAARRAAGDQEALRSANDLLRIEQTNVIAETRQAQLASGEYLKYGAMGLAGVAVVGIIYKSVSKKRKK